MALSLTQIFKPLNDFFVNLYAPAEESGVLFRFDKFGSVISPADFTDPLHPELGFSAALARERFSDLVNHTPVDNGDGMSLVFHQDAVDDTYFYRLLSPAQSLALGADDASSQAVFAAFSETQANALRLWRDAVQESSSGIMFEYKPSLAAPVNWYDPNAPGVWTQNTFSITAPTDPHPIPESPPKILPIWRIKLSDDIISTMVLPQTVHLSPVMMQRIAPAAPVQLPHNTGSSGVHPQLMMATHTNIAAMAVSPALKGQAVSMASVTAQPMRLADLLQIKAKATDQGGGTQGFALHNEFRSALTKASISDRFQLAQVIGSAATTAPAATDSITVTFSYALVKIQRPWLMNTFLTDDSWYIPQVAKGDVSNASGGNSFALQTIAFVVIKDLLIEANWPAADVAASANASDFGPFKVDGGIAQNKLSHAGIQVIGWIAQGLPMLPPNDPPAATPVDPPADT